MKSSLTEQIQLVAKGSTCLLALFREGTFKIPNQLFQDIQRTFTDTVYCEAKLQVNAANQRFFENNRMSSSHKSLDAFELAKLVSSIAMCEPPRLGQEREDIASTCSRSL